MTVEPNQPSDGRRPRGRGRRPAGEVRADVLTAVGRLLLTEGMVAMTFERVAKESGVSKTTLYRWWASPNVLALEGFFHAVAEPFAFADSGDIRADLVAQLRSFIGYMTATPAGKVLGELVGRSQTDPELAKEYRALYSSGRRDLAEVRLRKGQSDGQIRDDVDCQVLIDQLWGAVYHRLLIPDEPLTEQFADQLVDNLLLGIGGQPSS